MTVVLDYVGGYLWREAHRDENGDLHGTKKLWQDQSYYRKRNKEAGSYWLGFFILYIKGERQMELRLDVPLLEDVPKQKNFFNKEQWKKICSQV